MVPRDAVLILPNLNDQSESTEFASEFASLAELPDLLASSFFTGNSYLYLHILYTPITNFTITTTMPRQRRGAASTPARSAPTRPTPAPARAPPTTQQQSQPHSTAAHPPQAQQAQAPPQQSAAGPGLFGQMASTAA